MTIAAQYAKALYESNVAPEARLKNLRAALERRGHVQLLPQIFSEYKKLEEGAARSKAYRTITKESERNRILLELYQKLIHG